MVAVVVVLSMTTTTADNEATCLGFDIEESELLRGTEHPVAERMVSCNEPLRGIGAVLVLL